jgi:hypothetical protein
MPRFRPARKLGKNDIFQAIWTGLYVDVVNKVTDGVIEGVRVTLEDIRTDASLNMSMEYAKAMQEEEGSLNKVAGGEQGNPALIMRESIPLVSVQKTYFGGEPSSEFIKSMYTGLARIYVEGKVISFEELELVPDREEFTVNWALPLSDGGVLIKSMTIHPRVGGIDPMTGLPWTLWRAIEYGPGVTNYTRVAVREAGSAESVDTRKGGGTTRQGLVDPGTMKKKGQMTSAESVTFTDMWAIFMTTNGEKWYEYEQEALNQGMDCIRILDDGYLGGTHPIQAAIISNETNGASNINARVQARLGR